MPQQLYNRLSAVYDLSAGQRVAAEHAHWPHGGVPVFASRIADVHAFVVHETTGWPMRGNGVAGFYLKFFGGRPTDAVGHPNAGVAGQPSGELAQLYIAGDGTVMSGMLMPLATWHATFVNGWTLGSETGHSWGNYSGNDRNGPYTSTDETPRPPPNQDKIRGTQLANPVRKAGNGWVGLSGSNTIANPADDDLPGLKAWFRAGNEPVVAWWTTARYNGPWRQAQRVPEALFTEAQYRSWALLLRYVAEQFEIPRNFSLYPDKVRSPGFGADGSGTHGMLRDHVTFRAIVNADDTLSRKLNQLGLTAAQMATDAAVQPVYRGAVTMRAGHHGQSEVNTIWEQVFHQFRGFHGHGYSGTPDDPNNDHDCPGPMFDWHRLAREVWDWWWHPFDFAADNSLNNAPIRPSTVNTQQTASPRNGDTPLKEYWYSRPVASYQAVRTPGLHGATGSPQTFLLTETSRIHALAAGELVAARFPPETGGVNLAFVVVRHEVFHRLDPRAGVPPVSAFDEPVAAGRLDYDHPPSTVYTLYMHLGRPAGMDFATVVDGNPEWLNRFLMRAKEAELGLTFQTADNPHVDAALWGDRPPGGNGNRPTLVEGWTSDRIAYTEFLDALTAGRLAIPPVDPHSMPIRILLGDYLGTAGVIRHDGNGTQHGIRVEVFSRDLISTQFSLTTTDAAGRWTPQPGTGDPAVKYPSEWSQAPAGAEKTALEAAGVATALVPWWDDFQLATTTNQALPADARLEPHGLAVHYDPYTFMPWLNNITWHSEWPKYQVVDAAGAGVVPATPRPR
jgi:hypothetical protein